MFNNGLANLRANGEYDKIIDKYLESDAKQSNQAQKKILSLVFYKITGNKLAVVYSLLLNLPFSHLS